MKDKRLDQIRKYMKRDGLRTETIARRIGVTNQTVYNWIDGRYGVSLLASPLLDKFLADYKAEISAQMTAEVSTLTGK